MTKAEAVNWIINLTADIGKIEHQSLWHYEQALSEIREMLEAEPERKTGRWERHYSRPNVYADLWWHCSVCGYKNDDQYANCYHHYCPNCGCRMVEVDHDRQ